MSVSSNAIESTSSVSSNFIDVIDNVVNFDSYSDSVTNTVTSYESYDYTAILNDLLIATETLNENIVELLIRLNSLGDLFLALFVSLIVIVVAYKALSFFV